MKVLAEGKSAAAIDVISNLKRSINSRPPPPPPPPLLLLLLLLAVWMGVTTRANINNEPHYERLWRPA